MEYEAWDNCGERAFNGVDLSYACSLQEEYQHLPDLFHDSGVKHQAFSSRSNAAMQAGRSATSEPMEVVEHSE